MTIPMLVMLSLTSVAVLLSISALVVALRSSDRSLSRRLSALSTSLGEQTQTLEAQQLLLRNLRARIGMTALRARRSAESETPGDGSGNGTLPRSPPGESADDKWARETNLALALGRIRPGR